MRRPSSGQQQLGLPEAPARRIVLFIWGRTRRPRVLAGGSDLERWARAWARRWWVVAAANADRARDAIARYDAVCARLGPHRPVSAAAFGILEAGHNAPGGPDPPRGKEPERLRPAPGATHRRRATARGPTAAAANAH